MKYLLGLCIFCWWNAKGQNTYSINYRQVSYYSDSPYKKLQSFEFKTRLVYNDSISFFYVIPPGKKDKLEKLSILGDKLIHHGLIFNKNRNEKLNEVAWPKGSYFVIVDTVMQFKWIFNTATKNILGYNCNCAYALHKNNDTTLVWYNVELGSSFGPSSFLGLPGIPLEILDQRYAQHFIAQKIELTSVTLVLPDVKRLSAEEFKRRRDEGNAERK